MTATSLCNDTRRFDLDFLDDDELQLVCDEAVVKLPRDAADRKGGENISNRCCREGKKYHRQNTERKNSRSQSKMSVTS